MSCKAIRPASIVALPRIAVVASLFVLACSSGEAPTVPSGTTVGGPDQTESVTVTGPGGAQVTIPPGATPQPIRVAIAPAPTGTTLPPALGTAIGPAIEITPHGTEFVAPVIVRLPIDPSAIPPGANVVVYKANPGEPWVGHPVASLDGSHVDVAVTGFSVLIPAYDTGEFLELLVLPAEGAFWTDMGGHSWSSDPFPTHPAPLPVRIAFTGNPDGCSYTLNQYWSGSGYLTVDIGTFPVPSPGEDRVHHMGVTRPSRQTWSVGGVWDTTDTTFVGATLSCLRNQGWGTVTVVRSSGAIHPSGLYSPGRGIHVWTTHFPANRVGFTREPGDFSGSAGERAGFSVHVVGGTADPSIANEILWLRSDDGGDSWQPVAYNVPAPDNEDGLYTDDELNWYHTPPITAADDGALFRVRACATGPTLPAPQMQNNCQFSTVARLTVQPDAAPVFTRDPAPVTVNAGQSATFTVGVGGTPTPTLLWQRLDAGTVSWASIPGATSVSYTLPITNERETGAQFRAVATNRAGSTNSAAATLTVNPQPVAPAFTTQPADATVDFGQTATLTAVVTGVPAPSLSWQQSLPGLTGSFWVPVTGATGPSYTPPTATLTVGANLFKLVALNSAGGAESRVGTLTVNPPPTPPTISAQPLPQTVSSGSAATFSVTATGSAPLSYQWRRNGGDVQGATAPTYTTPATTLADDGAVFSVVVSNSLGSATSIDARLTVLVAPSFTTQPADATVAFGQTTTLTAVVAGSPAPILAWAQYLSPGGGALPAWTPIPGATGPSYTPPAGSLAVGPNLFKLGALNTIGGAESRVATITMSPGPDAVPLTIVSTSPAPNDTWVPYDDPVIITFSEAMDPTTFTNTSFYVEDVEGGFKVLGQTTVTGNTATFQPRRHLDAGWQYRVVVTGVAAASGGLLAQASSTFFWTLSVPMQSYVSVAAAGVHTLAIDGPTGTYLPVVAWGSNPAGALGTGIGDGARSDTPALVTGLSAIVSVDGAAWYSLALDVYGSVYGWGWGPNIGVDPIVNLQAAPIAGLSNVCAISAGYRHALALGCDGFVYGWGYEDPLVIDPPIGSHAVRSIAGLSDIVAVAAGERFSLALRRDGVVFAWGTGDMGQLGTGNLAGSATPVRVPGLRGITAIAAQSFTGVALRDDFRVFAWGSNNVGQVGNGTTTNQPTPVEVLTNVFAIATGNYHTLARMQDGTVMAWGYNLFGRLGDGTTTDRWSPVVVPGLSNVTAVSGGELHSVARMLDGSVWTWGQNSSGQLGIGGAAVSLVPARVTLP